MRWLGRCGVPLIALRTPGVPKLISFHFKLQLTSNQQALAPCLLYMPLHGCGGRLGRLGRVVRDERVTLHVPRTPPSYNSSMAVNFSK